jgi:hypothetical protein
LTTTELFLPFDSLLGTVTDKTSKIRASRDNPAWWKTQLQHKEALFRSPLGMARSFTNISSMFEKESYTIPEFLLYLLSKSYFTENVRLTPIVDNMDNHMMDRSLNTGFKQRLIVTSLAQVGPFFRHLYQHCKQNGSTELPALPKHVIPDQDLRTSFGLNAGAKHSSGPFYYIEDQLVRIVSPVDVFYFFCECDYLVNHVWNSILPFAVKKSYNPQRVALETQRLIVQMMRELCNSFNTNMSLLNMMDVNILPYWKRKLNFAAVTKSSTNAFSWLRYENVTASRGMVRTAHADSGSVNWQNALLQLLRACLKEALSGTGEFGCVPSLFQSQEGLIVLDVGMIAQIPRDLQKGLKKAMMLTDKIESFVPFLPKSSSTSRGTVAPIGIARYFRTFRNLDNEAQEKLNNFVNPSYDQNAKVLDEPKIYIVHENNIYYAKEFIRLIANLCKGAKEGGNFDIMEKLYPKLLNYSANIDFGTMFQTVIYAFPLCQDSALVAFFKLCKWFQDCLGNNFKRCNGCSTFRFETIMAENTTLKEKLAF